MTGIKETWRFVPVDEEGNPLRDTASHDIFLTVKQKDRDYHIGGTYNMLFCLEDDKGMNNETLVSIEQCFPASSTAKKAPGTGSRADRNARIWRKREESELPERNQQTQADCAG